MLYLPAFCFRCVLWTFYSRFVTRCHVVPFLNDFFFCRFTLIYYMYKASCPWHSPPRKACKRTTVWHYSHFNLNPPQLKTNILGLISPSTFQDAMQHTVPPPSHTQLPPHSFARSFSFLSLSPQRNEERDSSQIWPFLSELCELQPHDVLQSRNLAHVQEKVERW